MAQFYSNENFFQGTVEALRQLGHDVLTSHQAGNSGHSFPDEYVLSYCIAQNRILLTLNRKHFIRLHREIEGNHPGIVACTEDPDYQRQAQRIDVAIAGHATLAGQLLRVNRPNA